MADSRLSPLSERAKAFSPQNKLGIHLEARFKIIIIVRWNAQDRGPICSETRNRLEDIVGRESNMVHTRTGKGGN